MWSLISTVVQIGVLAFFFYYLFLFFRGTRGAQVLVGLGFLLAILIGMTQIFKLDALNWILRNLSVFLGVALLVIFQPEIRRALAELGKPTLFGSTVDRRTTIDNVVQAVMFLSEHRVGALIALEREIGLRAIQETGTRLDSAVVPELLSSLFFPHTPLHDGGVLIREDRIVAAGCVFPLAQDAELHKTLGTRHRAAMGLSEDSDAVVIVVSEETGTVSVCYRGELSHGLDREELKRALSSFLLKGTDSAWRRAREELDLTPAGIAETETEKQARGENADGRQA